jgi:hypothetical protein
MFVLSTQVHAHMSMDVKVDFMPMLISGPWVCGIGDCCFLSFPLSRIMYGRYRIDFCESVSISLWILSFSRLFGLFVCLLHHTFMLLL